MVKLKFEQGNNQYRVWCGNRIIGYVEEQESGFWLYDQRPNDNTTRDELEQIAEFMESLE